MEEKVTSASIRSMSLGILPWFFSRVHLADEVIDPQDECAHHGEETEEVSSVGQLLTSTLAQRLQL